MTGCFLHDYRFVRFDENGLPLRKPVYRREGLKHPNCPLFFVLVVVLVLENLGKSRDGKLHTLLLMLCGQLLFAGFWQNKSNLAG